MQYRVVAMRRDGPSPAHSEDSLERAQRLFRLLEVVPWGSAVALELQCSIDGQEWEVIQRRDRDEGVIAQEILP